jgi:serine/threonine protein kinase
VSEASERKPGDVLDRRYRLVRRLGRGGFGDVWRAEELLPDGAPFREVALKLLAGDAAASASQDWAEEAKLLASFRHASLVTIYAAGILDGAIATRFVAMELLEGANLADVIRARTRVPWRRVLRWAWDAAGALDVIHAGGVVHLDLKPANLFLTTDGALKVLDFGIARRAGARGRKGTPFGERSPLSTREANLSTAHFLAENDAFAATRPLSSSVPPHARTTAGGGDVNALGATTRETLIGTPGFMAPEVLEYGEPTAAADAYALAVCVVQLITGHLPQAVADEPESWEDAEAVSGWLAELRAATLRGALRDLDLGEARIPRGVSALLRRLLQVDPTQRGVTPGRLAQLFEATWERPYGVPEEPYFGLEALTIQTEGWLFGRDDDVGRLGREIEFEPCVVVQGGRGSGKTSLVRAGLAPQLARRGIDGKDDWQLVEIAPGDDPDAALDRALARLDPALIGASVVALARFAAEAETGVVLSIDPFDAVLDAAPSSRERLVALIAELSEGAPRTGLRLLCVASDERAQELLDTDLFGPHLRSCLRYVGEPSTTAARDIVGSPAHFASTAVYGVDAIAKDVQRELRAGDGRLAFIALALQAWWRLREREETGPGSRSIPPMSGPVSSMPPVASQRDGAGRFVLRAERWKELGGIAGALAKHADRVLAELGPERRRVADALLVRLCATDGAPASRSEVELAERASAAASSTLAMTRDVLRALVTQRLVRERVGQLTIAHPALGTSWPHLSSVRLRDMERLTFEERLRDAAEAWERADRSRDLLLSRAALVEANTRRVWLAYLTESERALLQASRRRERTREAGRAATVAFVLALAGGALWARSAIERANLSEEATLKASIHLEYVGSVAARAHRSDDPFARAAFIAEALDHRSNDPLLSLDLSAAVANVPHAQFLSLDAVTGVSFPWGDRFLLGLGSGGTITLVDFRSKVPEVIEDVDFEADPTLLHRFPRPVVTELRPHRAPLVERVPFAFDTAFATRAVDGEVRVFRLRESGEVALAAVAPMKCAGALRLAEAAPVLACSSEGGVARWDMRRGGAVDTLPIQANVADISSDGERVAAIVGRKLVMWRPNKSERAERDSMSPILHARWSPRDALIAVVTPGVLDIVSPEQPADSIFHASLPTDAVSARWDEGGVDFGVCGTDRAGVWLYLRHGGRAKSDPPVPATSACVERASQSAPEMISSPHSLAEIADRDVGPHALTSGFRLAPHRFLSRDLVVFDTSIPAAERLLRFRGKDEIGGDEDNTPTDSMLAVVREGPNVVAVQVGDSVRVYAVPEGVRLQTRKGNLLGRCPDGRLLAWTVRDRGDKRPIDHDAARERPLDQATRAWEIEEVHTGGVVASIARTPGLVIGTDTSCSTFYVQSLDGAIVAHDLEHPEKAPLTIAHADGYVYEVSPSTRREGVSGLLLALSSGAIARIDDVTHEVRVLAYATPRATALADGIDPRGAVFADATGVVRVDASGHETRLLESSATTWEDLSVSIDGASILLLSAERLSALDVAKHEIVGSLALEGKSRFAPWDDEGSVLAWSYDRAGGAEGQVIPRGVSLARKAASAVSNLRVDHGRLIIMK